MYSLPEDEMEIGLGIHGEKGLERVKVKTVDELLDTLMKKFENYIKEGDEVVAMVNNLGSCTDIEMAILVRSLSKKLESQKITLVRIVEGKLMSSLEMHGMSITFLNLKKSFRDDVLNYLDAPVDCKHWKISKPVSSSEIYVPLKHQIQSIFDKPIVRELQESGKKIQRTH